VIALVGEPCYNVKKGGAIMRMFDTQKLLRNVQCVTNAEREGKLQPQEATLLRNYCAVDAATPSIERMVQKYLVRQLEREAKSLNGKE
jgi:hypothetical protein